MQYCCIVVVGVFPHTGFQLPPGLGIYRLDLLGSGILAETLYQLASWEEFCTPIYSSIFRITVGFPR